MIQEIAVLDYLREKGSITSWEACQELGVTRLSAVVFNLKKTGYRIISERQFVRNRYGHIAPIVRYRIEG